MTWWEATPALVVALFVLFLPGLLLALAGGLRGTALLTSAPALSVGVVGAAGVLGGLLGVGWSPQWLALCGLLSCAAVYLLLRLLSRERSQPGRPASSAWLGGWPGTLIGAAGGALIVGLQVKGAMDRPDHIAQRYDDIFHLNAVRYILEFGNASTLNLGRMLSPERGIALYPSAWHAVAALAVQVTGFDIPVSVNMLNIVVASLVWPLSCLFLVRTIIGRSNLVALVTGGLATVFPAFPLALFEYGTLFPNMLSYSVLPVALGLIILLARMVPSFENAWPGQALLFAVACCGLVTAQPNGFVAVLAMAFPIGLISWWRWARPISGASGRKLLWRLLVLVAAGVVYLLSWRQLLLGFDERYPFTTGGAALGEAITGSVSASATNWLLAGAILASLALLLRYGQRTWFLPVFLVPVILYVIAASAPQGRIRMFVTGAWYQDAPRLAALIPMVTIVVIAIGTVWLRDWVIGVVPNIRSEARRVPRWLAGGLILTCLVGLCAVSFQGPVSDAVANAKRAYSFEGENADVLSLDERALFEALPGLVEEDTVLAVNPWNGGALAFAYTGIDVTQYHLDDPDKTLSMVAQTLSGATEGSEACLAAADLGIEYILDFGDDYLLPFEEAFAYPAFDNVTPDSGFELVHEVGNASLYRVANCG